MNPQDFTQQELEIIMHGLGELPLKMAGPVFTKVQAAVIQMMAGRVQKAAATVDDDKPTSMLDPQ